MPNRINLSNSKNIRYKSTGSRATTGTSNITLICAIRNCFHCQEIFSKSTFLDYIKFTHQTIVIFFIAPLLHISQTCFCELIKCFFCCFTFGKNKVWQTNSIIWNKTFNTIEGNMPCFLNCLENKIIIIIHTTLSRILLVCLPHFIAILGIKCIFHVINMIWKCSVNYLAITKEPKFLINFSVLPCTRRWIVTITGRNNFNAEFFTNSDYKPIQFMLFKNAIPLNLTIPTITKNINHLA